MWLNSLLRFAWQDVVTLSKVYCDQLMVIFVMLHHYYLLMVPYSRLDFVIITELLLP